MRRSSHSSCTIPSLRFTTTARRLRGRYLEVRQFHCKALPKKCRECRAPPEECPPELKCRRFKWKAPYEVEPHESDVLYFDFVVGKPLTTFEVYSHIANVRERKREIGWNATTVHDVPVEEGREGLHNALQGMLRTMRSPSPGANRTAKHPEQFGDEVSEVNASGTKQGPPGSEPSREPAKPTPPKKRRKKPRELLPEPKPSTPLQRQGPPED